MSLAEYSGCISGNWSPLRLVALISHCAASARTVAETNAIRGIQLPPPLLKTALRRIPTAPGATAVDCAGSLARPRNGPPPCPPPQAGREKGGPRSTCPLGYPRPHYKVPPHYLTCCSAGLRIPTWPV